MHRLAFLAFIIGGFPLHCVQRTMSFFKGRSKMDSYREPERERETRSLRLQAAALRWSLTLRCELAAEFDISISILDHPLKKDIVRCTQ